MDLYSNNLINNIIKPPLFQLNFDLKYISNHISNLRKGGMIRLEKTLTICNDEFM